MFETIKEDIASVIARDPSVHSAKEVLLWHTGMHAVWAYRRQHWLWEHGMRGLATLLARLSRRRYGVEIAPAATIGRRFMIDHGMGIVIGETAVIGDDCLLYQGVTLGMTGKHGGKRHPTLGNNVLIGAGTKVLGPVYIGDNARIGAGSVVLCNLPANCTAVGVPAEVVRINNKAVNPADDLDQQDLPDVVAQRIRDLDRRIGALENAAQGDTPPTASQIAARQKP